MIIARQVLQSSSEAMDITGSVGTSTGSGNGRESHKRRCLFAGTAEERGSGDVAPVAITGECTVCSSTSGVDCSLRNL